MRRRLFTLTSLVCSLAVAATVYKWVDEKGVVHYSDQPHPNAQKMNVQAAQNYKATAIAAPAGAPWPPRAGRRRAASAVPGLSDRAAGGRADVHQHRGAHRRGADRSGP